MLACWLGWMAPAFATSEVLQQFNAITSSDSFAGSITPPDPHGAVGPKGILASVNLGLAYYSKNSTNHVAAWITPLGRSSACTSSTILSDHSPTNTTTSRLIPRMGIPAAHRSLSVRLNP
jgi:hypothetical protein